MKYLIIYLEIEYMLNFLSQSEKGDFLDLMIVYARDQKDPIIENKKVANVFNFIKNRLDSQIEKALLKAETARKNGANGGRPTDKKKPKRTKPKPNKTQSVIEQEQFQSFWNIYNKKVSKPDAEKKFKSALKKESFEKIMSGLDNYIKVRGSDSKYWKNPSTWLTQECWNDEHSSQNNNKEERDLSSWNKYL